MINLFVVVRRLAVLVWFGCGLAVLAAESGPKPVAIPEPVLGRWVVTGYRFAGVAALSEAEAKAWVGKSLTIGPACMTLEGKTVQPRPVVVEEQKAQAYFDGFKTTPAAIGCKADKVCVYTVFDDVGGTLAVTGPNQALTSWDGVFFLLERRLPAEIADPGFQGKWSALSKNHDAILGDLVVSQGKLAFAKKGEVSFEVLRFDGREYILKLNREVDDGLFMRVGPVREDELEVASYRSREEALAPRKQAIDHASSWGVYVREVSSEARKQKKPKPPAAGNGPG